MSDSQSPFYARPQDKYGLLARWHERMASSFLEKVEHILNEHKVQSILDCTKGIDLYASLLKSHGWQVESEEISEISQDTHMFDAVICMENEFVRYQDRYSLGTAYRPLLGHLTEGGVLIFCLPDFELLANRQDKDITPLLLGEEHRGKKCSVIRYMRFDPLQNIVIIDYIYHMEDLSTGTITVDWEASESSMLSIAAVRDDIQYASGDIQESFVLEGTRFFVCSSNYQKYIGPQLSKRRFKSENQNDNA